MCFAYMCIVFSKLYRSEKCCVLDTCVVFWTSVLFLDKCIVL